MDLRNKKEAPQTSSDEELNGCLSGSFNCIWTAVCLCWAIVSLVDGNLFIFLLFASTLALFCPFLGYILRNKLKINKENFTGIKTALFILSLVLMLNYDSFTKTNVELTNEYLVFGIILLLVITIALIIITIKIKSENKNYKNKYSGLINIDEEINKKELEIKENENKINKLNDILSNLNSEKEKLQKYVSTLNDENELLEVGLYKPHFNFNDSSEYKNAINKNYEKQKKLIKDKKAVICHTEWTVEGSVKKGRQLVEKNIKLILKAFNGECDTAISNTRWNNAEKMETRIKKAFEDINKMVENQHISIQNIFLNLKLEELFLTYEYEQKKQDEKEEQRRIQEQIREEQKAIKEAEEARKKAEKEKADFEKALKLAHEQLSKANEEERTKFEEQIAKLQEQLKEAEEKQQRALSMAQQTKCGHIYVISNIGSFGENIYKIGMTRRLEPMDRINELGDASVPFKFDVHALIYSENAPELETKLHNHFRNRAVNMVNTKKEFFNVSLEEIEKIVKENYAEIEFTKIAEAKEYRETLAIKNAQQVSK